MHFCAQVRHWAAIPDAERAGHRDRLLQGVVATAGGPALLLTRLGVTLAHFARLAPVALWPHAVAAVMAAFQAAVPALGPSVGYTALCQVLAMLADELLDATGLPPGRAADLSAARAEVQALLAHVLAGQLQLAALDGALTAAALRCVSAWLPSYDDLVKSTPICPVFGLGPR